MNFRTEFEQQATATAQELLVQHCDAILDIRSAFKTTGYLSNIQRALIRFFFQEFRINILVRVRSPDSELYDVNALLRDEDLFSIHLATAHARSRYLQTLLEYSDNRAQSTV